MRYTNGKENAKKDKEDKEMEPKYYTVSKIEGEYAYLAPADGGEELFIAMALLPLGVDVGAELKYENFEFEIIV